MQQGPPAGSEVLGGLAASRVLLEHTVRALLARQKPQVQLLSGCLVSGLVWSPDGASVQGALPGLFIKRWRVAARCRMCCLLGKCLFERIMRVPGPSAEALVLGDAVWQQVTHESQSVLTRTATDLTVGACGHHRARATHAPVHQ